MTKPMDPGVSVADLREHLAYDPVSGSFTWRTSRHGKRWPAGRPAGYVRKGYLAIKLFQVKILAHRIAWALMHDEWPMHEIDHKDGNGLNNKWVNLRAATHSQNAMNSKPKSWHLKGVGVNKYGRWTAYICRDYHKKNLGTFATEREAHEVYVAAAAKLHGEWARSK